jgi:hypothetical protein
MSTLSGALHLALPNGSIQMSNHSCQREQKGVIIYLFLQLLDIDIF